MTTYSALRLFLRMEKPGRLPSFGNAGIKYVTPLLDQQLRLLKDDHKTERQVFGSYTNVGHGRYNLGPVKRFYSTSVSVTDVTKSDDQREAPKRKPKTLESPKIMLISETKSVSVVTLADAEKIAAKKSLHLVPGDSHSGEKTEKHVYRLITNAEFLTLDADTGSYKDDKEKKKEKEIKTVILKSKIAEHDVLSKVKQMNKWIEKDHSIRVLIGQAGEHGAAESVYKLIEENMRESGAKFSQKVVKGNQIRFHLAPPKEPRPSSKQLQSESKPHEKHA